MKAHKGKSGVAKWVMDVAIAEAIRQAEAQLHDVSARAYNEMVIAMHQAGLSAKTINRVQDILSAAVIPKMDGIRKASRHEDGRMTMMDADDWMRTYCEENGLKYTRFGQGEE